MKILFLGDYSNLHGTLAAELRRRGHSVTLLSDRCGCMDVDNDISLRRGNGPLSGFPYLYRIFQLMPQLRGYDVVQFVNPHFFRLKPGKLMYFLRELKRHNGSLFLSLAGNDHFFVKACVHGGIFRFSEFRVGSTPTEFARVKATHEMGYLWPSVARYTTDFYDMLDGAMSVLPEYDMAARPVLGDRLAFTNLPVILDDFVPMPFDASGKIKILVGMRSELILPKGTQTLLDAALALQKEMPERVEVENVRDLPWTEYKRKLAVSHIVLDQLYSYSPGLNALDTMALGRIAASGAQPEYYDYLKEPELRPIIPLSPLETDITALLRQVLTDPEAMVRMARDGRILVEKHNDARVVTDRYEAHWEKMLSHK